ncbi:MAG TPA: allantoinase, partial [Dehalococcoidia bacterium]|nr:allantoinase [Dehalococcoidia bacterium]
MNSQKADYIISGGLLVRGTGVTREDVLIKDGKIEAVGTDLPNDGAKRTIDASGAYVFPGIIDAHNHP